MTPKPIIHFAHANGVPSLVYKKLFDLLSEHYQVIFVPLLGPDKRYPIDNHWDGLVDQVIDSVVQQAKGQAVIGLGHSLGALLTYMASRKRPELFKQVVMLDPPLIMGTASFAFDMAKMFYPKMVDELSPAGLSKRRRDQWDSREQAAQIFRPKPFYHDFDPECFRDYIQYALTEDVITGGYTLTIPKVDELAIFRTNPSNWWRVWPEKPPVTTRMIVGEKSLFYERKFTEKAEKRLGIPFTVTSGGHMFPLEHPVETIQLVQQLIKKSAS